MRRTLSSLSDLRAEQKQGCHKWFERPGTKGTFSFWEVARRLYNTGQGPYKAQSRKGQGAQAERPTDDGGHGPGILSFRLSDGTGSKSTSFRCRRCEVTRGGLSTGDGTGLEY